MDKILPVITALPFYRVKSDPIETLDVFYYKKNRCVNDCHYGTITDLNHLPSFIVRVPIGDITEKRVGFDTDIKLELICPDGSSAEDIVPFYSMEIKDFVFGPAELELIANQTSPAPSIGDKYLYYEGDNVVLMIWNGTIFQPPFASVFPTEGMLVNVTDRGIVYVFNFEGGAYTDNGINPYLQGEFSRTINGLKLCDIGGFTYIIYGGFRVEDMNCGLRHLRLSFVDESPTPSQAVYVSELVDLRFFSTSNNNFNKLTIKSKCDLGNIPYKEINFPQVYYFQPDGGKDLVGEPEYEVNESSEEDGLGNETKVFSRVSKVFQLDTLGVPEYIVDFLMFSTQHEDATITLPLSGNNSKSINSPYFGERRIDGNSFSASPDWLEGACYATVNMRFELLDPVIKTGCCEEIDKLECIVCDQEAINFVCWDEKDEIEALPPSKGDRFIIREEGDGACIECLGPPCNDWSLNYNSIALWDGFSWEYEVPNVDRCINVLDTSIRGIWIYHLSGKWRLINSTSLISSNLDSLDISGYTYSEISGYVYYRVKGQFTWVFAGAYQSTELSSGINIPGLLSGTDYEVKLESLSNNCDYGEGDISEYSTTSV